MTIQQVYDKLSSQPSGRLYLSKQERDMYIDAMDDMAKRLQIARSGSKKLVHPFYRGKRIYLEK